MTRYVLHRRCPQVATTRLQSRQGDVLSALRLLLMFGCLGPKPRPKAKSLLPLMVYLCFETHPSQGMFDKVVA